MTDETSRIERSGNHSQNEASQKTRTKVGHSANKAFEKKMAALKHTDAKKSDVLSEIKHKAHLGSLIEQMSIRQQLSLKVSEQGISNQEMPKITGMSGADGAQTSGVQPGGETELDPALIDKIVEAVKLRVSRDEGQDIVKMDLSSYLPGTECRLSKTDKTCNLEFTVTTPGVAVQIREHESALLKRLKAEGHGDFNYQMRVVQRG